MIRKVILGIMVMAGVVSGQTPLPTTPPVALMAYSPTGSPSGPWNAYMAAAGAQPLFQTPTTIYGMSYKGTDGNYYACTLALCFGGGGGGSGTVTSFSATGLSPLFGVSVANPTTTPALSFTLSSAAANTLFGNNTGSPAAPSYMAMPSCSGATNALIWTSGTGFGCNTISGGGTTTNAATFNNSGSGAASGTTFDGSAARTISYNTLGAAPLASPAFTGTPTAPTPSQLDGSTKLATTAYTDTAVANAVAGVNPAVAVIAASTANVVGTYVQVGGGIGDTFTVTSTGAFSLDGIAINTIGQRVLLKNQITASQNGVYFASVVGVSLVSPVFTRALDYDTPSDVNNTGAIPVQSGTVNTTTSWLLTSQVTSIGSAGSALTYAQFTYGNSIPNSALQNSSTNVNGQTCTLGSSCTVTPLPETHVASGSTELDFTTCISSNYKAYQITWSDLTLVTGTSVDVLIQFSANGGSTYDTTSGHYRFARIYIGIDNTAVGTTTPASNAAQTYTGIPPLGIFAGTLSSSASVWGSGSMILSNPLGTTHNQLMSGNAAYVNGGATGNSYTTTFSAAYVGAPTAINAFRFWTNGTMTGTVTCQPLNQ